MDQAHDLSYAIEDGIKKEWLGVFDVVAPMEPMEKEGER